MNEFPWGKIIEKFDYNFEGKKVQIIKYYPWITNKHLVKKRSVDFEHVLYHCPLIHESFSSLYAALIGWIVYDNLGLNQYALTLGICKAMNITT